MKRKAPMNAFSAADAAAAAPEPAPEPAPPEVLIERKVTEIEKQTQDRIGLKKKQREKVKELERALKKPMLRSLLDLPEYKTYSPRDRCTRLAERYNHARTPR